MMTRWLCIVPNGAHALLLASSDSHYNLHLSTTAWKCHHNLVKDSNFHAVEIFRHCLSTLSYCLLLGPSRGCLARQQPCCSDCRNALRFHSSSCGHKLLARCASHLQHLVRSQIRLSESTKSDVRMSSLLDRCMLGPAAAN